MLQDNQVLQEVQVHQVLKEAMEAQVPLEAQVPQEVQVHQVLKEAMEVPVL